MRPLVALGVTLAVLGVASGWWPTGARADGDPASDVLVSQRLFLPQDAGLTVRQQAQLEALLGAARRSGYPLRVAIVASSTDLGSISELWRQPESYARFLGQELSLVYRGTLLVVMPNGFGLFGPAASEPAQRAALAHQPSPGSSRLGATAISTVQQLAAAAGHPLQVGAVSTKTLAEQTDYGALIALAVGAALVAVAWGASLRARPLRSRTTP